jgi:hypothetical protein
MCEAAQELVASIVMDDRLGHHPSEPRHPLGEPRRDASAVQWQIRAAGALRHEPSMAPESGVRNRRVIAARAYRE